MQRHRARSGFTLVELVIVLVVLALMAGLAAPRYASASTRYRLRAAAHRIATDVAQARLMARASSSAVTMSFKPGVGGWYEVSVVRPFEGEMFYTVKLGRDPYGVVLESADFAGLPDLVFDGHGAGTSGSLAISAGGWSCTLNIDGASGGVTISGL